LTWLRDVLSSQHADLPAPYSCVQEAGDMLFVPARWCHATLNEAESIGIAVEMDVGAC
jgi:ribosomal protein L16 Arg81 hydroxylase